MLIGMNRIIPIVAAVLLAGAPAGAQDSETDMQKGMDLLQQGGRLLLQGLMAELGPALEDLEGMAVDLNAYHLPEILPNGDIIIRRKIPTDMPPEPDSGEIDL